MPHTLHKPPPTMTVADFLDWPGDGTGRKFQLVDGEVRAMSPGSNAADTWDNVWSYCTIPSVQEIAIVHSTRVLVELLRRGADGHWPEQPEEIGPGGRLELSSIGFTCPPSDVYAQTHLA